MISRLDDVERTAGAAPRAEPRPPGNVDAWLGVLTTMLHMPEARRRAIRDELSEHLHQRCRELVLAGATRSDAVARALGELGETAELARRLEQAHRLPKRRIIMNVSMLGLGAAVISIAVVSMSARDPLAPPSVFEDPAAQRTPPARVADERVTVTEETTLRELLAFVRATHDAAVLIDWGALMEAGFQPDAGVGMTAEELPVPRLLEAMSRLGSQGELIDWRYGDAGLEVSTSLVFDRRERRLASYDIREILEATASEDEVTDLLLAFVSPDDWEENGGELARHQIVGGRLFIEAPPRMHTRAQWILGELSAGDPRRARLPDPEPGGGGR